MKIENLLEMAMPRSAAISRCKNLAPMIIQHLYKLFAFDYHNKTAWVNEVNAWANDINKIIVKGTSTGRLSAELYYTALAEFLNDNTLNKIENNLRRQDRNIGGWTRNELDNARIVQGIQ